MQEAALSFISLFIYDTPQVSIITFISQGFVQQKTLQSMPDS